MILGMSIGTYTFLQGLIILAGIGAGLIVMFGLLTGTFDGLTAVFLSSTLLTSLTGFDFPFDHLLHSHKVGIISIVVLAIAIPESYALSSCRGVTVGPCGRSGYRTVSERLCQQWRRRSPKVPALRALARTQKSRHSWSCSSSWCRICCTCDCCGEEVPRRADANSLTHLHFLSERFGTRNHAF
jgi:hypothetical protein